MLPTDDPLEARARDKCHHARGRERGNGKPAGGGCAWGIEIRLGERDRLPALCATTAFGQERAEADIQSRLSAAVEGGKTGLGIGRDASLTAFLGKRAAACSRKQVPSTDAAARTRIVNPMVSFVCGRTGRQPHLKVPVDIVRAESTTDRPREQGLRAERGGHDAVDTTYAASETRTMHFKSASNTKSRCGP